jgi:hypothetical protein
LILDLDPRSFWIWENEVKDDRLGLSAGNLRFVIGDASPAGQYGLCGG